MRRIKLLGLVVLALATVTFADCRGNKGGDNSAESDTLSLPDDGYGDLAGVDLGDSDAVDSSALNEPLFTEDKNGNLSQVEESQTSVISNNNKVYIISGSFTLYSNAQKQNTKLKAMGFDSKILEPYGQYNRVTVKEFATPEEARLALPALRSQIKDQTLWLLKR